MLRALAVASAEARARLPNVPTLAEAGIAGVEADAWFALFAPAKTPPEVLDRLYARCPRCCRQDRLRRRIAAQGMTLALRPPAEVAAWLPGEVTKWAAVIKAAGVTVE